MDTPGGDEVEIPFTEWLLASPYNTALVGILSATVTFAVLFSVATYFKSRGQSCTLKGRPASITSNKQQRRKDRQSYEPFDSKRQFAPSATIRRMKIGHELDRTGHSGGQNRLTNSKRPHTETVDTPQNENLWMTRTEAMRNCNPLSTPKEALPTSTDEDTLAGDESKFYPHYRDPTKASSKQTYRNHVPVTIPSKKQSPIKHSTNVDVPASREIRTGPKKPKDKYRFVSKTSDYPGEGNLKSEGKDEKHFKLIIPKNESFKLNITCLKLKPLEQQSLFDLKKSQLPKKNIEDKVFDKSVQTKQKDGNSGAEINNETDENPSQDSAPDHNLFQLLPDSKPTQVLNMGNKGLPTKDEEDIKRHSRKMKKMAYRNRTSHSSASMISLVEEQEKCEHTNILHRKSRTEYTQPRHGSLPGPKSSPQINIASMSQLAFTKNTKKPSPYRDRLHCTPGDFSRDVQDEDSPTADSTVRKVSRHNGIGSSPNHGDDWAFSCKKFERDQERQQKKSGSDTSSSTWGSGNEVEREKEPASRCQTNRMMILRKLHSKQTHDKTIRRHNKTSILGKRIKSLSNHKLRRQANVQRHIPPPSNGARVQGITYSSQTTMKNKPLKEFLAGTQKKNDENTSHHLPDLEHSLNANVQQQASALMQRRASARMLRRTDPEWLGDSTNALLYSSSEEKVFDGSSSVVKKNCNIKQSCRQERIIYRPCSAVAEALRQVPTFTLHSSTKEAATFYKSHETSTGSKPQKRKSKCEKGAQSTNYLNTERDDELCVSLPDCSEELEMLIKNTIQEMQKYDVSTSDTANITMKNTNSVYPHPPIADGKHKVSMTTNKENLTSVRCGKSHPPKKTGTSKSMQSAAETQKHRLQHEDRLHEMDCNVKYVDSVDVIGLSGCQRSTGEKESVLLYEDDDETEKNARDFGENDKRNVKDAALLKCYLARSKENMPRAKNLLSTLQPSDSNDDGSQYKTTCDIQGRGRVQHYYECPPYPSSNIRHKVHNFTENVPSSMVGDSFLRKSADYKQPNVKCARQFNERTNGNISFGETAHHTSNLRKEMVHTSDDSHHKHDRPMFSQQTSYINHSNVLEKHNKHQEDEATTIKSRISNSQAKTKVKDFTVGGSSRQSLKEKCEGSIYTDTSEIFINNPFLVQENDEYQRSDDYNFPLSTACFLQHTGTTTRRHDQKATDTKREAWKGQETESKSDLSLSKFQGHNVNNMADSEANTTWTPLGHHSNMKKMNGESKSGCRKPENTHNVGLHNKIPKSTKEARILKLQDDNDIEFLTQSVLPASDSSTTCNKQLTMNTQQGNQQKINGLDSKSDAKSSQQKILNLNNASKSSGVACPAETKRSTCHSESNDWRFQSALPLSTPPVPALEFKNRGISQCLHSKKTKFKSAKLEPFVSPPGSCGICEKRRPSSPNSRKSSDKRRVDEISHSEMRKSIDSGRSPCNANTKTFQLMAGTQQKSKAIKSQPSSHKGVSRIQEGRTKETARKYFKKLPFTSQAFKMLRQCQVRKETNKKILRRHLPTFYDKGYRGKAGPEGRFNVPAEPNNTKHNLQGSESPQATMNSLVTKQQIQCSYGHRYMPDSGFTNSLKNQYKIKSVSESMYSCATSNTKKSMESSNMNKWTNESRVNDTLNEGSLDTSELQLTCLSSDTAPIVWKYHDDKDKKDEENENQTNNENINSKIYESYHADRLSDSDITLDSAKLQQLSTQAIFELIKSDERSNSMSTSETSYSNTYLSDRHGLGDDFRDILNLVERCNSLSSQSLEDLALRRIKRKNSGFHPRLETIPRSTTKPTVRHPSGHTCCSSKSKSAGSNELCFHFIGCSSGRDSDITTLISQSTIQDIKSLPRSPLYESVRANETRTPNGIDRKPRHHDSGHSHNDYPVTMSNTDKKRVINSPKQNNVMGKSHNEHKVSRPSVHLESEQVSYMEIIPKPGGFKGLRLSEMSDIGIPEIVKKLDIEHFENEIPRTKKHYSRLPGTRSYSSSPHIEYTWLPFSSFSSHEISSIPSDKSSSLLFNVSPLSMKPERYPRRTPFKPNHVIDDNVKKLTRENSSEIISSPANSSPMSLYLNNKVKKCPNKTVSNSSASTRGNIDRENQRQRRQPWNFFGHQPIAESEHKQMQVDHAKKQRKSHSTNRPFAAHTRKAHEISAKKFSNKQQQTPVTLKKNLSLQIGHGDVRIFPDSLSSFDNEDSTHISSSLKPAQKHFHPRLDHKPKRFEISGHSSHGIKESKNMDGSLPPHQPETLDQSEKKTIPNKTKKKNFEDATCELIPIFSISSTKHFQVAKTDLDDAMNQGTQTVCNIDPVSPKSPKLRKARKNSKLSLNKKYIKNRTASRFALKNCMRDLQKLKEMFDEALKSKENVFSINQTEGLTKNDCEFFQNKEEGIPNPSKAKEIKVNKKLRVKKNECLKTALEDSSKSLLKFNSALSGLVGSCEENVTHANKDTSQPLTKMASSSVIKRETKLIFQKSPSFHTFFSVDSSSKPLKSRSDAVSSPQMMHLSEVSFSDTKIPRVNANFTHKTKKGTTPHPSTANGRKNISDTNKILPGPCSVKTAKKCEETKSKNEVKKPKVPENATASVKPSQPQHSISFTNMKARMKARRVSRRRSKLPIPIHTKTIFISEKRKPSKIPKLVQSSKTKTVERDEGQDEIEIDKIKKHTVEKSTDVRRRKITRPSLHNKCDITRSSLPSENAKDTRLLKLTKTTKNDVEKKLPTIPEDESRFPEKTLVSVAQSNLLPRLNFSVLPCPAIFLCEIDQLTDIASVEQERTDRYSLVSQSTKAGKERLISRHSKFRKHSSRIPRASAKNKIVQTDSVRRFPSNKLLLPQGKTHFPVKETSTGENYNKKSNEVGEKISVEQALEPPKNENKLTLKEHSKLGKIQMPSIPGVPETKTKQQRGRTRHNDQERKKEVLKTAKTEMKRRPNANKKREAKVPAFTSPNKHVKMTTVKPSKVTSSKIPVKTSIKTNDSDDNGKKNSTQNERTVKTTRKTQRMSNKVSANDTGLKNEEGGQNKKPLQCVTEVMLGEQEHERKISFGKSSVLKSPFFSIKDIRTAKAPPQVKKIANDDLTKRQKEGSSFYRIFRQEQLARDRVQNLKEPLSKTMRNQGFVPNPKHKTDKRNEPPHGPIKPMQSPSVRSTGSNKQLTLRTVSKPQVKRLKNQTEDKGIQSRKRSKVTAADRPGSSKTFAKVLKGTNSKLVTRNGEKVCLCISSSCSSGTQEIANWLSVTVTSCSSTRSSSADKESSKRKRQQRIEDNPPRNVKGTSVKKATIDTHEKHLPQAIAGFSEYSKFSPTDKCGRMLFSSFPPFQQDNNPGGAHPVSIGVRRHVMDNDMSIANGDSEISSLNLNTTDDISASVIFGNPSPLCPARASLQRQTRNTLQALQQSNQPCAQQIQMTRYQQPKEITQDQQKPQGKDLMEQLFASSGLAAHEKCAQNPSRRRRCSIQKVPEKWPNYYRLAQAQREKKDKFLHRQEKKLNCAPLMPTEIRSECLKIIQEIKRSK